ncbi:MAG: carboxypeptidase regulatory-like domain-containing protein [Terracidiphilus sp.]|jgi:hypothetical protein
MNLSKRLLCSAVLAALLSFVCGSAWAADSLTGAISGTVTDPSGAVIVGATVTLTNTDRGQDVRVLTTGPAGYFTATSLPLGAYTVKISAPGFKTETVTGLQLHAADSLTVNKVMVAGSVSEMITVTAAQAQLNLEDASSSGLISGDQMNELVLNSRNYEQFLQLQPGVVYGGANDQLYVGSTAPSGMSNTVNFSVNGGRSTDNNWTIDGADNVDRGANLTLLTYPSADAIAEVKTLRGQYSAEFGRSASGQIDVVTKSGTNKFHGSAYEFFRNNVLNANSWQDKLVTPFTARPVLRYNDFGESLGGPVRIPHIYNGTDKTFFFFSDETRRLVQYTTGTAFVPTTAERAGDFSNSYYVTGSSTTGPVSVCTAYNATNGACTAYGDSITITDPVVKAYLTDIYSLIPAPPSAADIAAGQDPHALLSTVPNIYNNNQVLARVDQTFSPKLSVFYRYIHDSFPIMAGSGTFAGLTIPGLSATSTKNPGTEHLGHVTYLFSPTMLANVGYAYSSNAIYTTPIGAFTTAISKDVNPTLPYQNVLGVIPTLSFTGSNALTGLGSTGIYHDVDQNHNVFGDLTKTLGRHTLIVGASYNHFEKAENSTGGNQGGFTFGGTNTGISPVVAGLNTATQTDIAFANFLIGDANAGFSQASNAITADILQISLEAFVQDNIKVSPRLTLNLGVRYGYYAQPTDGGSRLSNFAPATYVAANAPTIGSTGLICFYSATLCPNTNGYLTTNLHGNPNADYQGINYMNGLIFQSSAGITGHPSPYGNKVAQADKYNFAPRFGFSYDLFGNGKTALRGGYGWAYNVSEVSFYETAVYSNPPAVTNYSLSTAVLDDPAGTSATIAASTTPGGIEATPLNYSTPYTQQYSLDIQQQLSPTFMIDIGYFGSHGNHLIGKENIDEPVPNSYIGKISPTDVASTCKYADSLVTSATPPAYISTTCDRGLNQVRPYLGYVFIDSVQPIFSSNYNGLQVKATKKFKGKSMIDANYTWSRDLTNAVADYSGGPQNTYNINGDYGRASDDRNHVLAVDGVYELPWMIDQRGVAGHIVGGWEVSGILAMNSGLPLTITESLGSLVYYGPTGTINPINNQPNGNEANDSAGIGVAGNTSTGFRPNQIGNPRNGQGSQIRTASQWFYRGAFAAPLPAGLNPGGLGQVGNEHRGVVSAPGFTRFDLGLFRNFKIREGLNFQLRGEAFNLFNHTNLGSPGVASTTSSTFGKITTARDNRILQVAGKITF